MAEIVAEFQRRIAYIIKQYSVGKSAQLGDQQFNASLQRLRDVVDEGKAIPSCQHSRLHPEVELVVSHFAKKHAQKARW